MMPEAQDYRRKHGGQ